MADKPKIAPESAPEIDPLVALLAEAKRALESNDTNAFLNTIGLIAKQRKAIAEAQVKAAQAEATMLSGARLQLSNDLYKSIKQAIQGVTKQLQAVKATGFQFILAYEADGAIVKEHIALMVPTIKVRKVGVSGGPRTTTADTLGMSLSDLCETYGTEAEKATIEAAKPKNWPAKQTVKARILADHPELIKK